MLLVCVTHLSNTNSICNLISPHSTFHNCNGEILLSSPTLTSMHSPSWTTIMNKIAYKYDLPPICFMYIHKVWKHQINIKLYGQIDINVRHQFDVNSWCHKNVQFWLIVDSQLTWTVDIILMLIQAVLPTLISRILGKWQFWREEL